jgi:hypothetical protein
MIIKIFGLAHIINSCKFKAVKGNLPALLMQEKSSNVMIKISYL